MPVLSVKERGRGKKRDRVQMEWADFVFLYARLVMVYRSKLRVSS